MPPPRRKDVDGKPKQYVGIGRIGTQAQSEDLKPKFKPKGQFNVSEGRDYTLDAPVKQDEEDETPQLTNKKTKKPEEPIIIIPEVKSPAQVAAEKAAEWKR
jgi:hypothetical protein